MPSLSSPKIFHPFTPCCNKYKPRSLLFITSKISTLECLRITSLSKGYFFSPGLWTGACNKAIEVQAHPELTEQNSAPWLWPPVKHIQLSVDWPQMCTSYQATAQLHYITSELRHKVRKTISSACQHIICYGLLATLEQMPHPRYTMTRTTWLPDSSCKDPFEFHIHKQFLGSMETRERKQLHLSNYCFFLQIAYMTHWANHGLSNSLTVIYLKQLSVTHLPFPFKDTISTGNSGCPWRNFKHFQESWSLTLN